MYIYMYVANVRCGNSCITLLCSALNLKHTLNSVDHICACTPLQRLGTFRRLTTLSIDPSLKLYFNVYKRASLLPRPRLSRWSARLIFLVSSAEETWLPETGIGRRGAVTLIRRSIDNFKNVDYLLVGELSPDHRALGHSLIFTVGLLHMQVRNIICNHVGIALINYWKERLQHGVVRLIAAYRAIDGRYLK